MNRISINLLPVESIVVQKQIKKTKGVQLVSIVALLTMFFLATLVITLRILQTKTLGQVEVKASSNAERITELRDKESALVLLKDRLNLIDKLTAEPSKQKQIYDLVVNKIPPEVIVSSVTIDGTGNLLISGTVPDYVVLAKLFSVLNSTETFEDVSSVTVESLSRGRDGAYRISLKLIAKQ